MCLLPHERGRGKGGELPTLGEQSKQMTSIPIAAAVDFSFCLPDLFGRPFSGFIVCRRRSSFCPLVIMSVSLMVFSCSKWMNDLLKRYRVCSGSERDAILLAAARMEHQGWAEARNAGA
jgi:hypothetical protein